MAFVDSVKDIFSQAGQSAKGLTDTAKLNHTISVTEDKINELYGQIGYTVYCQYSSDPVPAVKELVDQINALHTSIEECKAQIAAINNLDLCPNCKARVTKGASFCGACGFKMEAEQSKPQSTDIPPSFCMNCGASLTEGSAFCMNCGAKIG